MAKNARLFILFRKSFVYLHNKMYGYPPGGKMRDFLSNVFFSFVGYFLASILLLVINILAGRSFGPIVYGEYALVLVISQILIFPVLLGLDNAAMRDIAAKNENKNFQKEVLSTSLIAYGIFSSIMVILSWFFAYGFLHFFSIRYGIFYAALIFTIIVAARLLLEGAIRALNYFKLQAFVKILDAVTVGIIFLVLSVYWRSGGYRLYVIALSAGAVITLLVYFIFLFYKGFIRATYSTRVFKDLVHYGKFTILGTIGGILLGSIDRLFVQKYLGSFQLGIYSAYYAVTIMITAQLSNIVMNVLFPLSSRENDRQGLLYKIDRSFILLFIPAVFFLTVFSILLFALFGKKYDVNIYFSIAMSISAVFYFGYLVYTSVISSFGYRELRLCGTKTIIAGFIYLFLLYCLITRFGIIALPFSYFVSIGYLLVEMLLWRKKYFSINIKTTTTQ